MTKLPHVTKLKLQNNNAIVFMRGKRDDGSAFFIYAEIAKEQMEKMARDAQEDKNVDLSSYGKVLLSGEGEPKEDNKQYMTEKWNFDHNAS